MNIETTSKDGTVTIALNGRLDSSTFSQLDDALESCLKDANELVIDMKSLEYISSAGLRVILKARKAMKPKGKMKLINVNDSVMEVFDITGFSEILTFG